MEYLDSSEDIYELDSKLVSANEALVKCYLDIPDSINYLNSLGVSFDFKSFMRYLLQEEITPHVWFSKAYSNIKIEKFCEFDNNDQYRLIKETKGFNLFVVNKGYVEISEYNYILSENAMGKIRFNNTPVDIDVDIFLGKSFLIDRLSGIEISSSWRPIKCKLLKKVYLKVTDLNSIAESILESSEYTESLFIRPDDICLNNLKEKIIDLEIENNRLKDKLKCNTKNSDYVIGGALIELLTEQKSPRRNQSTLKLELVEQKLKGMSQGSLNDFFAAANKALKASKDEG